MDKGDKKCQIFIVVPLLRYGTRQSEVSATAGEPGETDILAPAGTVSVRTLPEVVAVEQ